MNNTNFTTQVRITHGSDVRVLETSNTPRPDVRPLLVDGLLTVEVDEADELYRQVVAANARYTARWLGWYGATGGNPAHGATPEAAVEALLSR